MTRDLDIWHARSVSTVNIIGQSSRSQEIIVAKVWSVLPRYRCFSAFSQDY